MMRTILAAAVLTTLLPSAAAVAAGKKSALRLEQEARAAAHQRAVKAFAPFDGGEQREVARQGLKGKKRAAHPVVGDPAKVPGEGPPPPPLRPPLDVPESGLVAPSAIGPGLSSNPLYLAALGYQHVFTKLDGPRCAHLPTCSRFGAQAVARHGLLGMFMTLDRLIQPNDSSALRHLPEVEGFGMIRVYDPLENYQLWQPERFTGFLLPAPEQPLALPPLASSRAPSTNLAAAETQSP